jgi:hypothetical protein
MFPDMTRFVTLPFSGESDGSVTNWKNVSASTVVHPWLGSLEYCTTIWSNAPDCGPVHHCSPRYVKLIPDKATPLVFVNPTWIDVFVTALTFVGLTYRPIERSPGSPVGEGVPPKLYVS